MFCRKGRHFLSFSVFRGCVRFEGSIRLDVDLVGKVQDLRLSAKLLLVMASHVCM